MLFRSNWLGDLLDVPALRTGATVFVAVCVQAMPFLVLGVLISGAIAAFVPARVLRKVLPANPALAVPVAGLAGVALPGYLERRRMRSRRRTPECINISIKRPRNVRIRRQMSLHQVVLVSTMQRSPQFAQARCIRVREEPAIIGSHAKHPLPAMPHRTLVAVDQIIDTLQRSLIVWMPEPVQLPQRSIDLHRPPPQISMPVDYVPVLILNPA